jgi:NADPH2:quinone reductase
VFTLTLHKKDGKKIKAYVNTENLETRIKELTGGKGADVIYDAVGGDNSEQAYRSIAWYGRYLVIGFASGQFQKSR